MKKLDKINHFTFLKFMPSKIRTNGMKREKALFKCDCGNVKEYDYYSVKSGHTKQCWNCGRKSASEKRKKHGLTKHKLYSKWHDMKNRCYNKNVDRYKNYGACGVSVCDEWKNNFLSFYNWCIENGWKDNLQIDRIDVHGNYSPDNCRLLTAIEQRFNKKNTFYIEYKCVKIPLAKLLYINNKSNKYSVIWHSLKRGNSFESILLKYDLKINYFIK